MPPKSKVDRVNFVVWTYGDIYTRIAKQFEADWGVKVDSTISSFNDHPTKLATMFAAGEKIDVSQSSPFSFPNFVSQGLVEPIDDLPGAADYIKDFTPFTKQVATVKGKTMGLPYFSTVWVWNYYADMLEKLKIDKPFATYEEFIEHCVKAKKDGVSRYPVLWVAGVGLEQLPGTWYQMTWNRGGMFFDKQGNHMLGAGSVARETLKWWANTFEKGLDIADPESLKVQFTPRPRRSAPARTSIAAPTITTASTSPTIRRSRRSPARSRSWARRATARRSASPTSISCRRPTATRNGRWKLLQYLGGKTKDGNYTQAVSLAKDAMLGSGYTSVMNSDAVKQGWAPWGDVPEILKIWDKAAYIGEVCSSVYQPWHFPWTDQLNIEVQKSLTGQITADQCCDNLIKGIADAKRKV